MDKLKIIPSYTGTMTLDEAIKDARAKKLLWLEILFNDGVNWEEHLEVKEISDAYKKARTWYGNFKSIIEDHTQRKFMKGKIGRVDFREYRLFLEVLNFVSTYP